MKIYQFQFSLAKNEEIKSFFSASHLNSSFTEFDSVMSLNIPSSLDVNWHPHSDLSLEIMVFSESSEADFWFSRRRARWRL